MENHTESGDLSGLQAVYRIWGSLGFAVGDSFSYGRVAGLQPYQRSYEIGVKHLGRRLTRVGRHRDDGVSCEGWMD